MRTPPLGFALVVLASLAPGQDPDAGQAIYQRICAACHGPEAEGNRAFQAPSLRLQEDWYLTGELEKFRAGIRGSHRQDTSGPPMQLTATALDDSEIANVVAYVVGLGKKGLPPSQHALEGDVERGRELYASCAACHGANALGNPALRAPSLAGQWDWYVARQLTKFKTGVRGGDARDFYGTQMLPFALALADDTAIRDVAVYIRTLPPQQAAAPPHVPDLARGRQMFGVCASCHGESAQGNPEFHAPALAGQGLWYVARQLQNFRRGVRGAVHQDAFGTQMRALVGTVSEPALLDLAAYVASLPPRARQQPTPGFGGDLALGQRVYQKTCAPCHGKKGQGSRVLSAPYLAGQEDRYIQRQLREFRAGLRGADLRDPPGRIMRAWSASLADEDEIRSVAAYAASLEPQRADEPEALAAGTRPDAPPTPADGKPVGPKPRDDSWPKGLLSPGAPGSTPAGADAQKPDPAPAGTAPATESTPPATAATEVAPDAPRSHGAEMFATCIGCHGVQGQGNQTLGAPRIAGMGAWYLAEQIRKFQSGARGSHPKDEGGARMQPMAATLLGDEAILEVANYIAAMTVTSPLPAATKGDPANGQTLFATCIACHGARAEGNEALKAPPLSGQADWYVATQLRNFRAGLRGMHPLDVAGSQMRLMAAALPGDQAVLDVAAYVHSLGSAAAGAAAVAATDETATDEAAPADVATSTTETPAAEPTPPAEPADATPTGIADAGRARFATCIACHGLDGGGNSVFKAPALAGQADWYVATQLRNFKNGVRGAHADDAGGALMRPMALGLADDAVQELASYIAAMPAAVAEAPTLPGDRARGQALFATCIACHGADGMGNPALKAPSIAGQADWYVATQLRNFRSGVRGAHPDDTVGATMRPMAMALADEQAILDVAAYVHALKPAAAK